MGSPTASSFVTAIKVSSLPAVSFSSSSLVEVGVNCDYLIARRSTSGRVRELISALLVKDSASLIEIFRYGTGGLFGGKNFLKFFFGKTD